MAVPCVRSSSSEQLRDTVQTPDGHLGLEGTQRGNATLLYMSTQARPVLPVEYMDPQTMPPSHGLFPTWSHHLLSCVFSCRHSCPGESFFGSLWTFPEREILEH